MSVAAASFGQWINENVALFVVAVVCAALLIIALVALLIYCCCCRRRWKRARADMPEMQAENGRMRRKVNGGKGGGGQQRKRTRQDASTVQKSAAGGGIQVGLREPQPVEVSVEETPETGVAVEVRPAGVKRQAPAIAVATVQQASVELDAAAAVGQRATVDSPDAGAAVSFEQTSTVRQPSPPPSPELTVSPPDVSVSVASVNETPDAASVEFDASPKKLSRVEVEPHRHSVESLNVEAQERASSPSSHSSGQFELMPLKAKMVSRGNEEPQRPSVVLRSPSPQISTFGVVQQHHHHHRGSSVYQSDENEITIVDSDFEDEDEDEKSLGSAGGGGWEVLPNSVVPASVVVVKAEEEEEHRWETVGQFEQQQEQQESNEAEEDKALAKFAVLSGSTSSSSSSSRRSSRGRERPFEVEEEVIQPTDRSELEPQ